MIPPTERPPQTETALPDPDLVWTEDGEPRSGRFGDVYFSAEDGLAETRAVFLQGCDLPDAWSGRSRFVVGETGFGTGLNVLALLDLWARTRPERASLHVFSIEGYPLSAQELARAHARFPELEELSARLIQGWPPRTSGFHRIDFPNLCATLDLAFLEAEPALAAWSGRADAWFLDGFAPSTNPQMWRPEVLAGVAARSAPGARLATFTVAGAVRRGLAEVGFKVAKRAGYGRKRERLEAALPGAATERSWGRVAVIGAGVAGAAAVRALTALGVDCVVLDGAGIGAGASGNPAALVTPRLDAGGGAIAEFFAQAHERARRLYIEAGAVIATGVVQLEAAPRDKLRFDRLAAQTLYRRGAVERLDAAAASTRLGEAADAGALFLADSLTIDPQRALEAWLNGASLVPHQVDRVEPTEEGWRLVGADDRILTEADAVVVAAGWAPSMTPALPVSPVRGQVSWTRDASAPAAAWGGYVAPMNGGVLFGATHDRGEAATDVRARDHARNLETLSRRLPTLAAKIDRQRVEGRASVRATTPDRLPMAGEIAPGLHVLSGFGSRGFTAAPLLGEHVAALITGAPSPLPAALGRLVDPLRFGRELRPQPPR
jgi:tRNA 5-methylaminomethyl-2-thiouridine biosynthesis bifunctional protein